jgi:hypothetical protein
MLRSAGCRLKSPFKGVDPFGSSAAIGGAFLLGSHYPAATAIPHRTARSRLDSSHSSPEAAALPVPLAMPHHGRAVGVLDLQPIR